MHLKTKTHSGSALFSLLLLLVFTLFTLLLSGTGAHIYRNSAQNLDENYTSRTAIAYISEKVRQHNSTDAIFLSDIQEQPALVLRKTIEEEPFLTYIYYHDNALYELFVHEDTVPRLQSGSRIVELQQLTLTEENHILTVTAVSKEGNTMSMLLYLY